MFRRNGEVLSKCVLPWDTALPGEGACRMWHDPSLERRYRPSQNQEDLNTVGRKSRMPKVLT